MYVRTEMHDFSLKQYHDPAPSTPPPPPPPPPCTYLEIKGVKIRASFESGPYLTDFIARRQKSRRV